MTPPWLSISSAQYMDQTVRAREFVISDFTDMGDPQTAAALRARAWASRRYFVGFMSDVGGGDQAPQARMSMLGVTAPENIEKPRRLPETTLPSFTPAGITSPCFMPPGR